MRLQAYRSKHNLTQDYVAKKIQRHVTTVSKYESGEIVPSLAVMHTITKLTDGAVTMKDFIDHHNKRLKERGDYGKTAGSNGKTVKSSHTSSKKTILH